MAAAFTATTADIYFSPGSKINVPNSLLIEYNFGIKKSHTKQTANND